MSMPMKRKREQQEPEKTPHTITAEHHVHNWQEFLSEAQKSGLKIGLHEDYEGKGLKKGEMHILEEIIFFDKERGFILYAYTFSGKSVNYARLYGELQRKDTLVSEAQQRLLTKFNHLQKTKDIIAFAMDVRQGVKSHITNLEENFEFRSPWSVIQELEFVNTVEKDGKSAEERKTITQAKLYKCVKGVREIIGM